jgi:predicted HicB family RNase H-like nuclease
MFELKKEEYANKTFRLPVSLIKELSRVAQKTGVSVNSLVVQCCNYALQEINFREESKKEDK